MCTNLSMLVGVYGMESLALTNLRRQSIGPLYRRFDLSAAYCTCKRALTCSTGAAIKLTVVPAMIPAMPCPKLGRVARSGW